jgi:hypothetical protein
MLVLTAWHAADHVRDWHPADLGCQLRHRAMRSIRDYGMFDRRETPQYYPAVERGDSKGP